MKFVHLTVLIAVLYAFSNCSKSSPDSKYYFNVSVDGNTIDYSQSRSDSALKVHVQVVTFQFIGIAVNNLTCDYGDELPCFTFGSTTGGNSPGTFTPVFLIINFNQLPNLRQYSMNNQGNSTVIQMVIDKIEDGVSGKPDIITGSFSGHVYRLSVIPRDTVAITGRFSIPMIP